LLVFSFEAAFWAATPPQNSAELLRLVQTIPLPNVKGRIDHMDVDVKGRRLFVSGLENDRVEEAGVACSAIQSIRAAFVAKTRRQQEVDYARQ